MNQSVRPMSSSGRPLTGFARPGTQSRKGTSSGRGVEAAFAGGRPGTSRPMSVAGRFLRLGTQSMLSEGEEFINVDRLDLRKYSKRPALAKALLDYIIYHDHNPKKGLELAAEATKAADFKDWWWKARLGKCYYQLGMFREAERQFKSAIKQQAMVIPYLELSKIYLRLDQPNTALDTYKKASEIHPGDTSLILGVARVHDALNRLASGVQHYKMVLHFDSSNAEAMACLASHQFYTDQPELALRFYRRLLQMGVNNTELWNNLGLCCFFASQYDMTLNCFERALALANDDNMADVWYNVGQVAIGIGDLNLAFQAFKIAISVDAHHAESFNNLGILELRKGNIEQARSNFDTAHGLAPHMFEPFFNGALVAFKLGDCQESFDYAQRALEAFPEHTDSKELLKQLKKHFTML
jgi:tetratricopeptide repeat protein 8